MAASVSAIEAVFFFFFFLGSRTVPGLRFYFCVCVCGYLSFCLMLYSYFYYFMREGLEVVRWGEGGWAYVAC